MNARVLLTGDALRRRVATLGREIAATCGDGLVLVGLLDGSVPFLADLVRNVGRECAIDFLALSAYGPRAGRARLVKDLDIDLAGRAVVVVSDVVDTGLTSTWLLGELDRRQPRSLQLCTLVDRQHHRLVPVPLRWVGVEVGDDFVIGYGLGYRGRYRNLDLLAVADLDQLHSDPDAHVEELYGLRR
ncbi:MAG TPA: phosphoribosyltransferase family protein [Acidimicrobiales bacterium]|nr:phosphoribosyltransferase family protein [Acidimicrobiales bacterium]